MVQVGSVSLPCLGRYTCYVVGLDKETGEYRNSFGFRGETGFDNIEFVGRDTLLLYGGGEVSSVIEGGTNSFEHFIFHRIGGLTGTHQIEGESSKGFIYPNPVQAGGELKAIAPDGSEIEHLRLFNLEGKLIKYARIGQNEGSIMLDNIAPGIYLLNISTKEYEYTEKVVVVGR